MKSAVLPSLKRKKNSSFFLLLLSFFFFLHSFLSRYALPFWLQIKEILLVAARLPHLVLSLSLSRGRSCAFRSHLLPRHSRTYLFLSTPATTNSWIERLETRELLGLLDKQTLAGASFKCKIKKPVVFLRIM